MLSGLGALLGVSQHTLRMEQEKYFNRMKKQAMNEFRNTTFDNGDIIDAEFKIVDIKQTTFEKGVG